MFRFFSEKLFHYFYKITLYLNHLKKNTNNDFPHEVSHFEINICGPKCHKELFCLKFKNVKSNVMWPNCNLVGFQTFISLYC